MIVLFMRSHTLSCAVRVSYLPQRFIDTIETPHLNGQNAQRLLHAIAIIESLRFVFLCKSNRPREHFEAHDWIQMLYEQWLTKTSLESYPSPSEAHVTAVVAVAQARTTWGPVFSRIQLEDVGNERPKHRRGDPSRPIFEFVSANGGEFPIKANFKSI